MKTTRLLSALLLACMLVGLFSGCSGGGGGVTTAATTAAATTAAATTADTTAASGTTVPGTSYAMSDVPGMTAPGVLPIVTEPTTLTVGLIPNATVTDYEDNLFTKFVEENSGIDIEFYFFPTGSGEAKQKLQLMVASNQALPDIWSGIGMTAVE